MAETKVSKLEKFGQNMQPVMVPINMDELLAEYDQWLALPTYNKMPRSFSRKMTEYSQKLIALAGLVAAVRQVLPSLTRRELACVQGKGCYYVRAMESVFTDYINGTKNINVVASLFAEYLGKL